jgi:thiamine-phosphate pyrophosphorylase
MAVGPSIINKEAFILLQGLYAITDEILTPDHSILSQAETALQAGVKLLQYRHKSGKDSEVEEVCIKLQRLCRQYQALFIINDRPHLAQAIGADGLHVGIEDMEFSRARKIFAKGVIGVSCYGDVARARLAQDAGADYVAFGSFFPSPTKPSSKVVPMQVLSEAKAALTIPVCAIGGINAANIHEISGHGPDMISVVSAVFAGDIPSNVARLNAVMQG